MDISQFCGPFRGRSSEVTHPTGPELSSIALLSQAVKSAAILKMRQNFVPAA